jgi:hypothetical protein
MPVQLTFSRMLEGSKNLLVEFTDRRITERDEVTYSQTTFYAPQRGDRPWLKSVVETLLRATEHDVTVTVRPRTITIKTQKPITRLDYKKLKNAVCSAIQKQGLPVAVEA